MEYENGKVLELYTTPKLKVMSDGCQIQIISTLTGKVYTTVSQNIGEQLLDLIESIDEQI